MALVVNTRRMRDLVRSRLGPDVTFVVLDMAWEDLVERLTSRHSEENMNRRTRMIFRKFYENCEPADDDEPSTVGVRLVRGDTPEEVVEKILDLV